MDVTYLVDKLQSYTLNNLEKEAYIITLDGKQLQLISGKLVWSKRGHASSALTNHLSELQNHYSNMMMDADVKGGLDGKLSDKYRYSPEWYERYKFHESTFQQMVDELKASGRLKIERIK